LGGRKAIVCGSTRGIGKAVAIELALLGADVTLMARDETALRRTVDELPIKEGQRHEYRVADFNKPESVRSAIAARITADVAHILVNNTGGPPAGSAIDASPQEFLDAFSAHLVCN